MLYVGKTPRKIMGCGRKMKIEKKMKIINNNYSSKHAHVGHA
jgi:hypothetical protein